MGRYILADMNRVLKKVSFWIILILLILIFGSISQNEEAEGLIIDVIDQTKNIFLYACVPCGFFAMIYLIGEDLRAKTAQIAIGIGVKRGAVVMAKWLECVIFTAFCELLLILYSIASAAMNHANFTLDNWREILMVMIASVIGTGLYMAIVFPIIIASNGITLAMLVYIFLSTGLINKGLGYLEFLKPVQRLHIIGKTPTNLLNVCRSRMILGYFALGQWIGVILFIAAFLGLSILIYRKCELEF